MTWYYVDAGKQTGPVDDAQLDALSRAGKVQADTLVWRAGMENWRPYSEIKTSASRGAGSTTPSGGAAEATEVVCAECGKVFPIDSTIRYGELRVCASCKPIFVQKLSEGARIGTGLNYAGFWIRFAAVFVDGILLGVVNMVISFAAGAGFAVAAGSDAESGLTLLQIGLFFFQLILALSYEAFFIGKYGATLGKMACKLRVVTAEGAPVSYGRAVGRYFAKMLSSLICLIGYIMAAFDDEKRALHDRICNTRVVYK